MPTSAHQEKHICAHRPKIIRIISEGNSRAGKLTQTLSFSHNLAWLPRIGTFQPCCPFRSFVPVDCSSRFAQAFDLADRALLLFPAGINSFSILCWLMMPKSLFLLQSVTEPKGCCCLHTLSSVPSFSPHGHWLVQGFVFSSRLLQ